MSTVSGNVPLVYGFAELAPAEGTLHLPYPHANPYTKVQFVQRDLDVSRITATKYLDLLAGAGILSKVKVGRSSYYINVRLLEILAGVNPTSR